MKKIFIFLAIFGLLFAAHSVLAKGLGDAMNTLDKSVKDVGLQSDLGTSISTVVKTALALVGTIFLVLTVYAGILWMTAQGKEETVEKAKKIVAACIIGLFITLSAYAITYFVTTKLGGGGGSTNGTGGQVSDPSNPSVADCCCFGPTQQQPGYKCIGTQDQCATTYSGIPGNLGWRPTGQCAAGY